MLPDDLAFVAIFGKFLNTPDEIQAGLVSDDFVDRVDNYLDLFTLG